MANKDTKSDRTVISVSLTIEEKDYKDSCSRTRYNGVGFDWRMD